MWKCKFMHCTGFLLLCMTTFAPRTIENLPVHKLALSLENLKLCISPLNAPPPKKKFWCCHCQLEIVQTILQLNNPRWCIEELNLSSLPIFWWSIPFTNRMHESAKFTCWEESIMHKQATQDWVWLPRRSYTNHGQVHGVLVWCTSYLKFALFVKGIFVWIIVLKSRNFHKVFIFVNFVSGHENTEIKNEQK